MNFLKKILNQENLASVEAENLIHLIAQDGITDVELASVLTLIQFRGLTLKEMIGFRDGLQHYITPLNLDASNAIDVCGTGGDGKDTFNISTTTAFILSAMGHKVIKHGNYGVSSVCGSSNVLEYLGYQFSSDEKVLQNELEDNNICFLHAPLFHPVLKKVGSIRKQLNVRTFFNALGPLLNPVQPAFQLSGTFNLELAKMYQHLLKDKRKEFKVVYSLDGYDEITLTGETRVFGKLSDEVLNARSFGVKTLLSTEIIGGEIDKSAKILLDIIEGKGSNAQMNVVAGNVAMGLSCFYPKIELRELFNEALLFIKSGKALIHHKVLNQFSKTL